MFLNIDTEIAAAREALTMNTPNADRAVIRQTFETAVRERALTAIEERLVDLRAGVAHLYRIEILCDVPATVHNSILRDFRWRVEACGGTWGSRDGTRRSMVVPMGTLIQNGWTEDRIWTEIVAKLVHRYGDGITVTPIFDLDVNVEAINVRLGTRSLLARRASELPIRWNPSWIEAPGRGTEYATSIAFTAWQRLIDLMADTLRERERQEREAQMATLRAAREAALAAEATRQNNERAEAAQILDRARAFGVEASPEIIVGAATMFVMDKAAIIKLLSEAEKVPAVESAPEHVDGAGV